MLVMDILLFIMLDVIFGGFNDIVCVFFIFNLLRIILLGFWMKELLLRKIGEVFVGIKFLFNKILEEFNDILVFLICCI